MDRFDAFFAAAFAAALTLAATFTWGLADAWAADPPPPIEVSSSAADWLPQD